MACRIGIDTGGTHTDLVLLDEERDEIFTLKVPTTPHDYSEGILDGIFRVLGEAGRKASDVDHLAYGTTVVTNQLIQRNDDTRIALIATEGFRDVIEIQHGSRFKNVYDVAWKRMVPLVPRRLRFDVPERMAVDGSTVMPLDEVRLNEICDELLKSGVEGVVVTFVNSYVNPAHERRAADIISQRCPKVAVTLSTDVSRQFREYERTSTATINAYVRGPMKSHLAKLQQSLEGREIVVSPFIMRANGGMMTFDSAAKLPVSITHSGPTAGIMAGVNLGQAIGVENLITFDMGGTSSDVSLIRGGKPLLTGKGEVEGWPVLLPMLDLITIGAGGGTKAWLDTAGSLKVGPLSAGAVPGPASYDTGGTEPTITDCNLVLGRLDATSLLGGRRKLRLDLAVQAINDRVARQHGMSTKDAALAIIAIAESHMVDAVKQISVRRGLDPREFGLVGFGGAGPLHALSLAQQLEIDEVFIPPAPGNFSALGQLAGNIQHDLTTTLASEFTADNLDAINGELSRMIGEGAALLAADDVDEKRRSLIVSLDLSYWGQNHEVNVGVEHPLTREGISRAAAKFHSENLSAFGFNDLHGTIKCVNLRVSAVGQMPRLKLKRYGVVAAYKPSPVAERQIVDGNGVSVQGSIYKFDDLTPGAEIAGLSVVQYAGSTLFVPQGWTVSFDEHKIGRARRTK